MGIAIGGPPPSKKIAENCGKFAEIAENCVKIVVFGKGNCGRDVRENFNFPDSGHGKGQKKIQGQTKPKPSRKYDFSYLWSILTNFV
jgi:hypothetical protein